MKRIFQGLGLAAVSLFVATQAIPGAPEGMPETITWVFDLGPRPSPLINDMNDGHLVVTFERSNFRLQIDRSDFTTTHRWVTRFSGVIDGEPIFPGEPRDPNFPAPGVVGISQFYDVDGVRENLDLLVLDFDLENGGAFILELRSASGVTSERLLPQDHFLGIPSPRGLIDSAWLWDTQVFVRLPDGRVKNGAVESWVGTRSSDDPRRPN